MEPKRLQAAARADRARQIVRATKVELPAQQEMALALEEVRLAKLSTPPGRPLPGVRLVDALGSGKTTAIEIYRDSVNGSAGTPPGAIRVLKAELDTQGTAASIPSAILRSLGEPRSDRGNVALLWDRVFDALAEHQTELLIIDEFNFAARRPTLSAAIGGALKRLIDHGVVGLALVGTAESMDVLRKCDALLQRLDAPVRMPPFDPEHEPDVAVVVLILRALDQALVDGDVIGEPAGLADDRLRVPLQMASKGNLRSLCRIVEHAAMKVARQGQHVIIREDLSIAVEEWAMPNGLRANPFEE